MNLTDPKLEDAIVQSLRKTGPCTLDELNRRFPSHGWNMLFDAVDRMSRDGRLLFLPASRSEYWIGVRGHLPSCNEGREQEVPV